MASIDTLPADLPLFEGVPQDKIPHVLACLNASLVTYDKRERILERGETTHGTGYLCEGRACVVNYDFWGNRSILGEYSPGSVIAGEQFFNLASTVAATVIAATPCVLIIFNLEKSIAAKPCCMVYVDRIRLNLARITMQMNTALLGRLDIVSNRSTREKVLAYLSDQATKNKTCCFEIPYNRQELADALYVERCALSHELSRLQRDGYITLERNRFELHKLSDGCISKG
ncbi:MAG: Crp/Fnr family transcriptional regulator [Raoultibacter sp.]